MPMRKHITFALSSIFFIALISFVFTTFLKVVPWYPQFKLQKGWVITYKNQQYLNTDISNLSDQLGLTFSRGDKITLTRPSPLTKNNAPFPYLVFKTQHCAYEVFLDGYTIAKENLDARTDGYTIQGNTTEQGKPIIRDDIGDNQPGPNLVFADSE